MTTTVAPDVAAARQSLQSARRDLDDAVGLLPGVEGDNTMANPNLIALLLRAVVARRHLYTLEETTAPGPAGGVIPQAAADRARDLWR